ncbi:MAG: alpha/beta fold hydrolase [Chlamydiia bacterium]
MDIKRVVNPTLQVKRSVIIIGGFASTLADFNPLVEQLKSWCTPITILLPEGDFPTVIEKIQSFIESLSSRPLPIIGYSMGGRIALELLKKKPELFERAICLSSRLNTPEFCPTKRGDFEALVQKQLLSLSISDFFHWWYQLPIFAGYIPSSKLLKEKMKIGSYQLLEQFSNLSILKQPPLTPPFKLPIHLVYGSKDSLKEEIKDCFKDSLEPIFIHNIPESGHLIHLEQPALVSQLLKKVIQ